MCYPCVVTTFSSQASLKIQIQRVNEWELICLIRLAVPYSGSVLPPRFLLLVELRALPGASILLLPTQPPITVPALSTKDKHHQPATCTLTDLNMIRLAAENKQVMPYVRSIIRENSDSSALHVPARSDRRRCLRHVYCQLTGTRVWTSINHAFFFFSFCNQYCNFFACRV